MASKYPVDELQQFAQFHAEKWWKKATKIFGDKIGALPPVKINTRLKTTAGTAYYSPEYVEFAAKLMMNNKAEYAIDVIPHELAHIISVRTYGYANGRGHGPAWKGIALKLYGSNQRCHNMKPE